MKSIGMTRNYPERAELLQFILDTAQRQTAIPHYLSNIAGAPFAPEQ